MKEHTVRGHFWIVRGLIPIVWSARCNQYDPDKIIGTYNLYSNTVLDYVVDMKLIFESTFESITRKHGRKRMVRLYEYLDGRPIGSYYWHERKEIKMDLRLLARRIRAGGYPVRE